MAYCEFLALREEGENEALKLGWDKWQETAVVNRVLESFYRRIETERGDHWREILEAEETNLRYARKTEPKAEGETQTQSADPAPLADSSGERISSHMLEKSESIGG